MKYLRYFESVDPFVKRDKTVDNYDIVVGLPDLLIDLKDAYFDISIQDKEFYLPDASLRVLFLKDYENDNYSFRIFEIKPYIKSMINYISNHGLELVQVSYFDEINVDMRLPFNVDEWVHNYEVLGVDFYFI